jgi:hypothetical protein
MTQVGRKVLEEHLDKNMKFRYEFAGQALIWKE